MLYFLFARTPPTVTVVDAFEKKSQLEFTLPLVSGIVFSDHLSVVFLFSKVAAMSFP